MKAKIGQLILFFLSFYAISAHSADNGSKLSFADLLTASKMVFQLPSGWAETKTVDNDQMNYEYAVKHPDKKFEVRYAIRPLGGLIEQYKKNVAGKKPGEAFVDPNKLYPALFQAIALNISNGRYSNSQEFDKSAVKEEFNADWGSMSVLEANKAFGQGYTYCLLIAIHKDDCADAYLFFMADTKENLMALSTPVFYALKFE